MLKKRLAGNFAANIFSQGINALWQLATIPLFLAFWSKEHYGEWILLSSIPSYLSVAEAGISTASANEVSMFIAQGRMADARRSLHTAWGFLLGVCAGLLPLALLASFVVPWKDWLHLAAGETELAWTIFVLCLYTLIGLASSIFGAIYRAVFNAPRNGFITGAGRLLELVAIGLGVAYTSSMLALAVVLLAARLVTTASLYWDSMRLSPDLRLGLAECSLLELKRIWRPSLMFLSHSLGNAIYFQGLTMVVGWRLGPGVVVQFNTTRALTRVILQLVIVIKHSLWPEFSYLFGAGDLAKARRLNELALEVSWLVSLAISVVLCVGAPWIMATWTHRVVEIDRSLLALFLAGTILNSVWFVTSGLLMGINRHEGLSVCYLGATIISLFAGLLLVGPFGLYGIAWAMILCEILLLPYAIISVCRLLQYSPGELIDSAWRMRQLRLLISQFLARRRAAV